MRCLMFLIAIFICWGGQNKGFAFTPAESKITVKVAGEDGGPIEGANVGITFQLPKGKNNFNTSRGFSDASGLFAGSSISLDYASYGVKKNGYYKSYGKYLFKDFTSGRWLPWNPTVELLLRKVENPVPMYKRNTKKFEITIPVIGKEAGFDLMDFDWVSPYGKGTYADFTFKLERHVVNFRNFDSKLTITFANKHDGMQVIKEDLRYGSQFKLPRYAPDSGYQPKLIKTRKRIPGKSSIDNFEKDNSYIFRVRSVEEDGKLVKAMYGKVQGEIRFDPRGSETAGIYFEYYLNPDYTRNLEMGRNLFKR